MSATPPANWYTDPLGRYEKRYWDGSRWTEHVTSRGVPSLDPPVAARSRADWHPDPFGRHELRYWDGKAWTQHVTSSGMRTVDPPLPSPVAQVANQRGRASQPTKKVARQVRQAGATSDEPAGGTVFTERVLVVNQKPKLIGNRVEYGIYDQHGRQISSVRELSRGIVSNALSMRPVENRTRRLQVVDLNNRVVLALTRPANFVKSTVIVHHAHGGEAGRIVQKTLGLIGGVQFALQAAGRSVGSMKAEGWNAWDFGIEDAAGSEIARITKTWAGWAKERFTKADNYVVEIHKPLQEPLRSLVVATALTVDVALKEGPQTHGSWSTRRYR